MKFGRYASFLLTVYIVLGFVFLSGLCFFVYYAIETTHYTTILAFVISYFVSVLIFSFFLHWIPQTIGGHFSDYVVFTEDKVELHGKEILVTIKWSEVIEIQPVVWGRGVREIKIIARDGTQISFTSHGNREKYIWKMHPELKSKLKTGRM